MVGIFVIANTLTAGVAGNERFRNDVVALGNEYLVLTGKHVSGVGDGILLVHRRYVIERDLLVGFKGLLNVEQ